MNPGEILLIGAALVGSILAFAHYRRGSQQERERRARERQGAENAARERARLLHERCALCGEPTDPAQDLFDEKTQRWWHAGCWRDTVR